MSYQKLIRFGDTLANALPVFNADPLTYCIGNNVNQRFNHGSNADVYGQNGNMCQTFLAQRCAANWDDVCEYAANPRTNDEYATRAVTNYAGSTQVQGLTSGEVLLRNTAMEKYRVGMTGDCQLKTEPFDPINPSSPYISHYVGRYCVPIYAVDPATIDDDVVMNKILQNPKIAVQLLTNIKNTMTRAGTFHLLAGTKLGDFYGLEHPNRFPRPVLPPKTKENFYVYDYARPDVLNRAPHLVPTLSGYTSAYNSDWWPTRYLAKENL